MEDKKVYKIQDLLRDEFVGRKVTTPNEFVYSIDKIGGNYFLVNSKGVGVEGDYALNEILDLEFELIEESEENKMKEKELKLNNFNKRLEAFIDKHKLKEIISKYNFNNEVKVYLASGFLFEDLGQIGLELLADICEAVNLDYYLPQHADFNDKSTTDFAITNKMITDGDNKELMTCNFVLAHIQSPMDDGVCGEISRFKTMSEYEPNKYWGVVAWTDDIRLGTKPNPEQPSFHNQCLYLNQYCIGEVENSLGCYETLDRCFAKMYEVYIEKR